MNTVTFGGYLAEQIRVCAEHANKTPEAFVLSLFDAGCNAPTENAAHLPRRKNLRHRVQCTSQKIVAALDRKGGAK